MRVRGSARRAWRSSSGWRVPALDGLVRAGPGAALLAALTLAAVAAPWLAPHDPAQQSIIRSLTPPVWVPGGDPGYWLGTDGLGRDILSRLIWGARVSLFVGLVSVSVSGALGTALGLLAGYAGGWVDAAVMRLTDILLAVPAILLAIAIVGVTGSGLGNVIVVIALTAWARYARLIRAETLVLRAQDYVALAEVAGCGTVRMLFVHLLPNVAGTLIVLATLDLGRVVIFEASLSYLGLGVQPPTAAWGSMVAEGRQYFTIAWWLVTFPGLAILATVLGSNLLGDRLRARLDPQDRTILAR